VVVALSPHRRGIQKKCDGFLKGDEKFSLGRERGSPLITSSKDRKKRMEKKGFPMKIMIIRYNERRFVVYLCDERRRPRRGSPAAV
jgi:hypothetical protein